jgi:hypothetical protein
MLLSLDFRLLASLMMFVYVSLLARVQEGLRDLSKLMFLSMLLGCTVFDTPCLTALIGSQFFLCVRAKYLLGRILTFSGVGPNPRIRHTLVHPTRPKY